MPKRSWLFGLLGLLLSGGGLIALLIALAWLMRPDLPTRAPQYDPRQAQAARAARNPQLSPDNPPQPAIAVNYDFDRAGPTPAWYPKGQSPILADLVRQGKLPPVIERVGEEPLVLKSDEIGAYGGTWQYLSGDDLYVFSLASRRFGNTCLVRWSPQGYPIVPNFARSFTVSDNYRVFTFTLRKGARWSDGVPFTADDIMYWWQKEMLMPNIMLETSGVSDIPPFMKVRGKLGRVEKIDDYHVRFSFDEPNGYFLPKMCTWYGLPMTNTPKHYLEKYHPIEGDQALIEKTRRQRQLPSAQALYAALKDPSNPEHPRLWPWIYRTYNSTAPFDFVRNPYYWAVDTQGNQLPYIDRMHYEVKSSDMAQANALGGDYALSGINAESYTQAAAEGPHRGYHLVHWYNADRVSFTIQPNLNRYIEPDTPGNEDARRETANKHRLLNQKQFRQALSLAINRQDIIDAVYAGEAQPAQAAPGPQSPFYEPSLLHAFTQYDPGRANRMLDELGLNKRDWEGYRTFPDGSRMTFYIHFIHTQLAQQVQFVVEDWARVGIRAVPRLQGGTLFYAEKSALKHDFDVWNGNDEYLPIIEARAFAPVRDESNWAMGYAWWYMRGGLYGDPRSKTERCVEPPPGSPVRRALELYDEASARGNPTDMIQTFKQILRIAADNVWTISICTAQPSVMACPDNFRNVPAVACNTWDFLSPGNAYPERFFITGAKDSPGAVAQIQAAMLKVTPAPMVQAANAAGSPVRARFGWLGAAVRYLLIAGVVLALLLVAVRHPYIGRRLLIMIPTLMVISIVVFVVIQLPPEDCLTARLMDIQRSGQEVDMSQVKELRGMFRLDEPLWKQYAYWMGFMWFFNADGHGRFDPASAGLLQGSLGRSMDLQQRLVSEMIGDRLTLTFAISLFTILLTWAIAVPAGIYSAVRQYSLGDYALTFLGFLGMCVPPFLFALVLLYLSRQWFGINVSGLFSARYGAQPEWDWPKFLDLLKHIWVPVLILGVGGTAGMIRVMRANLLDELRKPYVVAAMARGVRPTRLLLKYPVRLALNPFISGIGGLFPALISGGAIVAIVLSLPTIGPLLLSSLLLQDMFVAGSMLMILSLLAVVGTLVSDLLLLWLDPRIRFQGGAR